MNEITSNINELKIKKEIAQVNNLSQYIDHTILKPDATNEQIVKLCSEAVDFGFASVCVNPVFVSLCYKLLYDSSTKICTVIGFPLGATFSEVKETEANISLIDGASELDLVINITDLKNKDYEKVYNEIEQIVRLAHLKGAIVKVIIETCLLTLDEKIKICEIVTAAKADFIKTSTGFSNAGATIDDIVLLKKHIGPEVKVKASGGIRTLDFTLDLIISGAARIGTSSGCAIINEFHKL